VTNPCPENDIDLGSKLRGSNYKYVKSQFEFLPKQKYREQNYGVKIHYILDTFLIKPQKVKLKTLPVCWNTQTRNGLGGSKPKNKFQITNSKHQNPNFKKSKNQ